MSTKSFTTFMLGEQLFGIDILVVREINKHLDITPVYLAPEYIRGLVNLRGQLVTVMDLNALLGLGLSELSPCSHNVILKTSTELAVMQHPAEGVDAFFTGDKVGFIVDDIGDVVYVETEEIEAPPANIGDIDGRYLSGVVKLEGKLLPILSTHKLLQSA